MSSDKTEQATPRRIQKAKEQGQTGQSRDLVTVLTLLAVLFLLRQGGMKLGTGLCRWSESLYETPWLSTDLESLTGFLTGTLFSFLMSALFYVALLIILIVVFHLLSAGWHFLPEKVTPDFERVNPANGFARLFSLDSLIRTGAGLMKISCCLLGFWWTLSSQWETILGLGDSAPKDVFLFLFDFLTKLAFTIAFLLFLLACGDVFWQRWKLQRDLRMTPQEIRDEMKETLGDPLVIQKRRELQQTIARGRSDR